MENKGDELMEVTVTEKECIPTVMQILQLLKDTETPELIGYVAMKMLCAQMEKALDIRGARVSDPNEN